MTANYCLSLQDMKKVETIDDVEAFLLKHGENIVDMLGGEIDRIELKLRVRYYLQHLILSKCFSARQMAKYTSTFYDKCNY